MTEEKSDLENFLEDEEQPEIAEEVEIEKEPEQVEESQGVEETEPPAVEEEAEPKLDEAAEAATAQLEAFKRAAIDERRKRQVLEQHYANLQQQEKQEEPKTDFWENPELVVQQTVQAAVSKVQQESNARILNMSEAQARSKYGDYQEKFEIFSQMVGRDPAVYQQMLNQADPAEYAYRAASRLKDIQEIGNIGDWRERERAKLKQELMAEMETSKAEEKIVDITSKIKPSLASVRSSATNASDSINQTDEDIFEELFNK